MPGIILVHWNAGEAEERAATLRSAGFEVKTFWSTSDPAWRRFRDHPPSAFVIDLSRLPSQGRALATAFRQQKGTRAVPLVFAGGAPEKVEQTRKLLPDATYTDWSKISAALAGALAAPPARPVVPGTMQGYSGTPLPKKLGIREGGVVALAGAPEGFEEKLQPLADGVAVKRQLRGRADHILLFVKSKAALETRFPAAAKCLAAKGGLWIVWPKKASGVVTDISETHVRRYGLANGFVDYKICAVDETWSGLLFARRAPGKK